MRYILFDLDGTLTNPKIGITLSVAYALESFGIHVEDPDTLCKFIGPPLKESFMRYYGMSEEEAVRTVEKYRERFGKTGIFENEVYNGIPEMLKDLKAQGKILATASSKPEFYVRQILDHFGLSQYFTVIAGSEMNGERTKKAEVIQYTMEQLGVKASKEIIMVGDREHDIIGAKEQGVTSVGVLYGFGCKEELEKHGADYIVESVHDLGNLLCSNAYF